MTMTDDEITALLVANTDESGNVPDEIMAQLISGEMSADASETEGESLDPDDDDQADEDVDEPKGPIKADADPEPVILAKDGKHTIPYSELTTAREEARVKGEELAILQAKMQEQADILSKLQEAKETDEETGTTVATDDLMADLAEDYPGAAQLIKKLTSQLEAMTSKQLAADAEVAAKSAALTAQEVFDRAVTDINAEYPKVKDTDEFWAWFDKQPSYIQATAKSGDPRTVADVVSTYLASAKPGDTGKPVTATTAAEAIAKAKSRPAVTSLSDVPGGSNPATDEIDAVKALDPMAMANKFSGMNPTQVEALLARML